MFLVILLCLVGAVSLLWFFQEKLIYFPERLSADQNFSLPETIKERVFLIDDIEIHSLQYKVPDSKGIILYFHGNAGSLLTWGGVIKDFEQFGYDMVVIDYRGYGKSGGLIKNEAQLHSDAEFIYNELEKEYQNFILYGRSIGTGVASELATKKKASKLILETPYYSLPDLVGTIYPFLPSILVKYKLDNAKNIQNISTDVHLIHGTRDTLIPYDSSLRLSKLGNHITLHTIPNGEHNNLPIFSEYHQILVEIFGSK